MAAADKGDVKLNGNWHRIELPSYRVSDIVDFSPRASTPGGSILHSELGLYQPLLQTDWRHGFGHAWYEDAQGYMITDGNVDTRHQGVAMLFSKATTHSQVTNVATDGAFLTFASALFAWGTNGLWKYTGTSASTGWTQVSDPLTGTGAATSGSAVITGTGTSFLTEVAVGDKLTMNNVTKTVTIVTDATHVTMDSNYAFTSGSHTITNTISGDVNLAMATGTYLFFCYDGCRLKKMTPSGEISNAGLDANAKDYAWAIIAGGRMYFGIDQSSRVHHTNQEDASDLEGTTADTDVIYIGTGGYINLGAAIYAGKLYIFRVDGVWLLDTQSHIPSKVLDLTSEVSSVNFRGWAVHNGFLVFPVRDRIYQWNGVRLADITPPVLNDQFPYVTYGRFDNLQQVGRFLYCNARTADSVDGVTHYEDLLCYDGVGWFKLARLVSGTSTVVSTLGYDVVTNRLWVQYDAATDSVDYFPFQNLSEYPYADFPTTGTHSLKTSRLDMGFRRVSKSIPSLLVEASNVTANRYLLIYYAIDGGSWTLFSDGSNLGKVTTNGVSEMSLAASATIEFKYVQFRIDFVTDSAAQTPVLESLTVRFIMRPDVAYGYSFQIIGANRARYGQFTDSRSAKDIIDQLRTARDSKAPLAFQDIWGVARKVYVSSVQERAIERHLKDNTGSPNEPSIEQVIQVNLVEVG
jgi:hypothetical protein